MADVFDENGLTVQTSEEIRTDLDASFRGIYGSDINVEQNSPDGQVIGILTQLSTDLRELLVDINNGFDPDFAAGVILDQRVAINNIARAGGTFTIQPIDIVVDRTVTLEGLDDDFDDVDGTGYTIQDSAGSQFILIDSETLTAGSYTRNFRAKESGLVETTVGTITTFVTIVLGVTSVINSSGSLEVGEDEETDSALRVRRQRSVALGSAGYLNGLEGALLDISGVTDGKVYENYTNATDADGIPAHSIWCIIEGGSNEDIAATIQGRKTAGAGMKGDVSVSIPLDNGAVFIAQFDRPNAEDLHIRFDIQKTLASAVFDQATIKAAIVSASNYDIGGYAETSSLTATASTAIADNGGGGVPVNMEISNDGVSWVDYLDTATKDNQFTVDSSRITITEL